MRCCAHRRAQSCGSCADPKPQEAKPKSVYAPCLHIRMSLDQNLFTLNIVPSPVEQDATDLIEPNSETVHYRKRRAVAGDPDTGYTWSLYGE